MADNDIAPPSRVRVALIDDHLAIRVGLAGLFSPYPDFDVVASAASVPEALMQTMRIDVVVLDLRLKDGSTIAQNAQLLRSVGARVVAFTSGDSLTLIHEATRGGVVAIVRKSDSFERLIDAVHRVMRGEVVVMPSWAVGEEGEGTSFADARLTAREREVLARYAAGARAEEVAQALFISRDTVLMHVKRVRAKYAAVGRAAPSKVHLLRRALEDGLL